MSRGEVDTWVFVGAQVLAVGTLHGLRWLGVSAVVMPSHGWSDEAMLISLEALMQDHREAVQPLRPRELMAIVSDSWLAASTVPWPGTGQPMSGALLGDCLDAAGHEVEGDEVMRVEEAPWRSPRVVIAYGQPLLAVLKAAGRHLGSRSIRCCSLGAATWAALGADVRHRCRTLTVLEPNHAPGHATRQDAVLIRSAVGGDAVEEAVARRWNSQDAMPGEGLAQVLQRLQWPAGPEAPCALVNLRAEPGINSPAWPDWVVPCAAAPAHPPSSCSAAETLLGQLARSTRYTNALGVELAHARHPSPKAVLGAVVLASAVTIAAGAVLQWRDANAITLQLAAARRPANVAQAARQPGPGELRRIAAVNAAVGGLNFPMDQVLQALQPPADIRAGLLALELTGSAGHQISGSNVTIPALKVQVESPSARDMTRYVAFLGERGRGDVWLRSYTVEEQPRVGSVYRYHLDLAWAR